MWSENDEKTLNMEKTYEIIVRGKTLTSVPSCIATTERKTWLKLLGITLEEIPNKWDRHVEEML